MSAISVIKNKLLKKEVDTSTITLDLVNQLLTGLVTLGVKVNVTNYDPTGAVFFTQTPKLSTNPTITTVTITDASTSGTGTETVLIPANANRKFATVFNNTSMSIAVRMSASFTSGLITNSSLSRRLEPLDYWECPKSYAGAIAIEALGTFSGSGQKVIGNEFV